MDKNITILILSCLLPLSCKKNTQDPEPEYNSRGTHGAEPTQERTVTTHPWERAGTPAIPDGVTIQERFRSLMFDDGLRMDYNGDTAEDGHGIGHTDDEEICRQEEVDGEVFGVCMELFGEKRVLCKIDNSPQSNCDEVYSELGNDFTCESGTINKDPALECSDGWGVLANGERGRSKTICRVLLSDNSGRCLNAYKEEDDGTGTLIPLEAEDLILNMQPSSWEGYDSGHASNSSQSFDSDPPLNPHPLTNLLEDTVLNYKTLNASACTVDNDQDETNGIKGTLSFIAGSAPSICTIVLTIEKDQYADKILSFDIELVEDNDSTWSGYANALAAIPYNGTFYVQESLSPDPIAGTLSAPESSYETGDESICTVDESSGEVTAVAAGTCIVNRIVSQDGYLDKRLPAVVPVTPVRQYQGITWTGFPDDGDVTVGDTSSSLPVPTPIPLAVGIDDHTVEWKSGDCTWVGGATRTITFNNTTPCIISVTIKKRGYADFVKDFTVNPNPGVQSGLSWSPSQSNGSVGADLVLDAFSVPLTNNESLSYVVSNAGDTGCTFKGLSGSDARTLVFREAGTCIAQAVVSRSGYANWNSAEVSIVVTNGSITVGDWGNYEDVLNGQTTDAPELTNVIPANVRKSYDSNTENECTVDSGTGVVSSLRIGDDNCTIALTLSRDGYNDETHTYTLSVLAGIVEIHWNGYNTDTISFADRATPPSLLPPVSTTPGATFAYNTDDTTCSVHSATGALSILTSGTCTITLTASANNYRSINKNVTITITQTPQPITLSPADAADVYGTSPTLSVGTTLSVDSVGATLPGGGVGPLTYQPNDENICTTDSTGTVTGTGVGFCIISLYFAGDGDTEPSNSLEVLNIVVEQGTQTITPWNNPYGASPQLKVNGNNLEIKNTPPDDHGHGTLEYSSADTSICEVDTASGEIDPMRGGNCIIQIRYTGDDDFLPSTPVTLATILVRKFTQPPLTAPDDPYGSSPTLTVGTNLFITNPPAEDGYTPVEYRSQYDTVCLLEAETGEITPLTAGICVIEAHFSESEQYQPSGSVVIASITVSEGSLDGELSWTPTTSGAVGTALVLETIVGITDTDTVTYAVTSGSCSFGSGDGAHTLSFTAVGVCTVSATVQRVGYMEWNSPDHDINVEQGSQTLTPPTDPYGNSLSLSVGSGDLNIATPPTAGEGPTLYRSTTTTQCTVDENTGTLSPVAAGECTIEAQYAGNSNYLPSDYVEILRTTIAP